MLLIYEAILTVPDHALHDGVAKEYATRTINLNPTRREYMDILHIGGIADQSTMNLPESVSASRHSFKLESDFPTDKLNHHDYKRQYYLVEQAYAEPSLKVQVMVHVGMPESVARVLVGAHFGGSAVVDTEESS